MWFRYVIIFRFFQFIGGKVIFFQYRYGFVFFLLVVIFWFFSGIFIILGCGERLVEGKGKGQRRGRLFIYFYDFGVVFGIDWGKKLFIISFVVNVVLFFYKVYVRQGGFVVGIGEFFRVLGAVYGYQKGVFREVEYSIY